MTRIHIARDRQPLGNFSPDEVADGLKSGRFLPSDLAWQEPMEAWKPLGEFTNLPEPEVEDDDLPASPAGPRLSEPASVTETEPAWERRGELGFLPALTGTVKQVLGDPSATFSAMRKTGGFGSPLLFYTVLSTLGWWVLMIFQIITIKIAPQLLTGKLGPGIKPSDLLTGQITLMILAPLFIAVGAFISAGMLHVVLMGVAGTEKSFETTFRAYCYAAGATAILLMIPACGFYVYPIATAVLLIFAIRDTHKISGGKAAASVLIPTITCCGLALGSYAVLMVMMGLVK